MSTDVLVLSKDDQLGVWDFSCKLAKSKMVPVIFQNKPEDVFVTVIMGRELGIAPIMALNAIVVIQGTVTLKVQTMNAVVRSKCPTAIIEIKQDHEKREVRVTAKRDKDDPGYESMWNMETAKLMGLSHKDNWIKQPMNMLKARALSDALRAVFPDVLLGLYSYEEMEDTKELKQVDGEIKETFSQTMRREAEAENPIPEEEKILGPLYRFTRGKLMNKQVKDVSYDEFEVYLDHLQSRKEPKNWEKDYIHVITQVLQNFDLFQDAALETAEA